MNRGSRACTFGIEELSEFGAVEVVEERGGAEGATKKGGAGIEGSSCGSAVVPSLRCAHD